MSARIALVCQPDFLNNHVGVRNYILALARLISAHARVDFITFDQDRFGRFHWSRIVPQDLTGLYKQLGDDTLVFQGTPAAILKQLPRRFKRKPADVCRVFKTSIGSDLSVEHYDAAILTNPWMVSLQDRIPCDRLLGLVLDLVPNQYVFTRPSKPLEFATLHQRGFSYFRRHCDTVLTISRPVATQVVDLLRIESERTVALPPLLPAAYRNLPAVKAKPGSAIVLASPFDPRKGLKEIPAMLNGAREAIDTVAIYGWPRCRRREVRQFFRELDVRHVAWYPAASSHRVQELFANSNLLLFPSHDEGLGLPILEAQVLGCQALVRDKPPMNELVRPGTPFVDADAAATGRLLKDMLSQGYSAADLQAWAVREFEPAHVWQTLAPRLGLPTLESPKSTLLAA